MKRAVWASSEYEKWDTPPSLVDDLAGVFSWDLDVCASHPNVCANFFTEADDGLSKPWDGLCWMNPPYGRNISWWVEKARLESGTVVSLLPARTDTIWWHENVSLANVVVLMKGRQSFGSDEYWAHLGKNRASAPFPSAFVVWGGGLNREQVAKLSSYGWRIK